MKTLKGTRALHAVKCVEQNNLCTRHLSRMGCFRQTGMVIECVNAAIAGPWTAEALRPQLVPHQPAVQLPDDDKEPGDQPAQEPVDQPAQKPSDQLAQEPGDLQAQKPGDQPA